MTNKIEAFLKAINDRMTRALPTDTVKNPKLNVNVTSLVSSTRSYPMENPQSSSHLLNSVNDIKHKYVESLELGKNGSALVQGETPKKMKDPRLSTLPCRLGDFKRFNTLVDLGSCVNLILLDLFKNLRIGFLDETDHVFGLADETKSGFLTIGSAIIDCKKVKIAIRQGITRLIFGVKEIDLGDEDVPYLTTLGKRESYEP
nr:hypothetical protein [Tanacetum cinerariifolium]